MKICLWRYKENARNYPGYHLSADTEGCRRLRALLRSIRNTEVIELIPPDQDVLSVPNNRGGQAKYFAATNWRVETKSSLPAKHFVFSERGTELTLECSRDQIECILAGIDDIERRKGDYCIGGDDDDVLWFWWQIQPRRKG